MMQGSSPTTSRTSVQMPPTLLLYIGALTPSITLYLHLLFSYAHTILMRRDENVFLVMFQQVSSTHSTNEVVSMVIPQWILTITTTIASLDTIIGIGRGLSSASAIICTIFTALIAQQIFPNDSKLPPLTIALLSTSTLFIEEGTIIRFDMSSLAVTLISIWLIIRIRNDSSYKGSLLFVSGLLFGVAVQIKPLALAVVPLLLPLWYQTSRLHIKTVSEKQPNNRYRIFCFVLTALWYSLGMMVPFVITFLKGSSTATSTQLIMQLDASTQISFITRLNHTITTYWDVILAHFWLILLWLITLYLHDVGRKTFWNNYLILIAVWPFSVMAILMSNYPSWNHHYIYVLPPIAIGGAWTIRQLGSILMQGRRPSPLVGVALCIGLAMLGPAGESYALQHDEIPSDVRIAATIIQQRTPLSARVWTDNLAFPLLTMRQTDPWLSEVSIKRIIAGQMPEPELLHRFRQHPPAAVVVYDGLFDAFPHFINCVRATSDEMSIALGGKRIYWVHAQMVATATACQTLP